MIPASHAKLRITYWPFYISPNRVPTLFLPQEIGTFKEKKGDFLAIYKGNLARL